MRGYYVVVGMVVVALWGLNASRAQPERTAGLVLLTLQEAEMLRLTEEEWARPVPAERPRGPEGAPLGPHILFQTPQPQATSQGLTLATFTPTDLLVLFEKQDAEVNMESLRVLAHKGPFSKDLTEKLQPYIDKPRTRIEGRSVEVPEGKFWIEVAIADMKGAKTVHTYRLEVKGKKQ